MEIKVTKETPKIGVLNILIAILFGIFLTSIIFAFPLKLLETVAGLWLALVFCIILVLCGFYYTKKRTFLRLVVWGMLGTIVIGTAAFIIGVRILSNLLEGGGF